MEIGQIHTVETLRKSWIGIAEKYSRNHSLIEKQVNGICARYDEGHRHYHTLRHISFLFSQLKALFVRMNDPDAVFFAIWFHDAIYDPSATNNEIQSAELARRYLNSLHVPDKIIEIVEEMILRTEKHKTEGADQDATWFLDADLSILGSGKAAYKIYLDAVRHQAITKR